jgi:hypothetical protein
MSQNRLVITWHWGEQPLSDTRAAFTIPLIDPDAAAGQDFRGWSDIPPLANSINERGSLGDAEDLPVPEHTGREKSIKRHPAL